MVTSLEPICWHFLTKWTMPFTCIMFYGFKDGMRWTWHIKGPCSFLGSLILKDPKILESHHQSELENILTKGSWEPVVCSASLLSSIVPLPLYIFLRLLQYLLHIFFMYLYQMCEGYRENRIQRHKIWKLNCGGLDCIDLKPPADVNPNWWHSWDAWATCSERALRRRHQCYLIKLLCECSKACKAIVTFPLPRTILTVTLWRNSVSWAKAKV